MHAFPRPVFAVREWGNATEGSCVSDRLPKWGLSFSQLVNLYTDAEQVRAAGFLVRL